MRTVKPSGDFLVKVVTGGHEATAKVSDVMKAAGMAQLATDAAGNAVGLSGGLPASGVPFGPPTTIFRLRMRCSGGSAVVSVVATKRSGGSDTFNFSLSSGGDVSEPMYADDYSSLVWTKTGTGAVTLEVI